MEYTDNQKRMLGSALGLFSTKGFKATTTKEIAERTGMNELTIFRNFGTKERLLEEVIDFGLDTEGLKGSLDMELTGNIEEDLFSMISKMRSMIRERESIYALMFREISTNDIVKKKLGQVPIIMKEFMLMRLSEILNNEERDDVDSETAGIFLASYYLRSEMMRIMMGSDPFHDADETRLKDVVRIFLHGYLKRGDDN